MFERKQSFSLAVAALLFQVIAHRVAAEVPDHGSRTEADFVSFVLQAPANIHVVAGGAKDWIKAIDGFQRFAAECHIAAGDMLGDFIVQ